ncbi:mothers against decapentaplegic homolog 4-like [Cotesia glomerata]|uniref:MH2 domain-containing protein n=1 Tax=Cotesia glomerata TaxID=32391 RepID=A0AAV7IGN7_COTGL|nr:mothers against decapentaplegic homolog 4-like [Cotesia glomerata]KAH0550327.1 hypothetical protein KQX54_018733 [Cotesia glomerata]
MVNDSPNDDLTKSTPRQSEKSDRVCKNGKLQSKDDTEKISQYSPSNGTSNKNEEAMKELFSDYRVFENWCSIKYYEFNTQVGETFHVTNNSLEVNVNNYTNYSNNNTSLCLGKLTNESRNKISETIKNNIGQGIIIYLQTNGDIWLRQNCNQKIFVESNFLTKENILINKTGALQICTHAYNKIFSMILANEQMKMRINSDPSSKNDKNNFKEFFTIYVSFGEVWGPNCPKKTINETPCWLEIFFHPASKLLDILLSQ